MKGFQKIEREREKWGKKETKYKKKRVDLYMMTFITKEIKG